MKRLNPVLFFTPLVLLVLQSRSFELQDTIHSLMEENIHLHDRLENLTEALRELKQMLWRRSTDPDHHDLHERHSEDVRRLWDEWSQHSISAETLLLLERSFCGRDARSSAPPPQEETAPLLLMSCCIALVLMFCL